jgi:hypothetical protein
MGARFSLLAHSEFETNEIPMTRFTSGFSYVGYHWFTVVAAAAQLGERMDR